MKIAKTFQTTIMEKFQTIKMILSWDYPYILKNNLKYWKEVSLGTKII